MKQSPPLFSGIIYFLLGGLFTYFAIQDVQQGGWSIFPLLLVFLATFDIGTGLKLLYISIFPKKDDK